MTGEYIIVLKKYSEVRILVKGSGPGPVFFKNGLLYLLRHESCNRSRSWVCGRAHTGVQTIKESIVIRAQFNIIEH